MTKIILSVNAGSSSLKVSVYKVEARGSEPEQLAEAQLSGLTAPPVRLSYRRGAHRIHDREVAAVADAPQAFAYILQQLQDDDGLPAVSSPASFSHACHRVVHGGDYAAAHELDAATYEQLQELTALAPLHNAAALAIVRAVQAALPAARNVAVFDSAFHRSIPAHICTYAIDPAVAARNRLRKYGFHGISYAFIARATAAYLAKPVERLNIVALHLGSGASACAIRAGQSLDTSMGLTPLAGLPGATRSGSVDPSLVFHFTHDAGRPSPGSSKELHVTAAEEILNKQSGWKALTGTTDFGQISGSDSAECKLAFALFVNRVQNYVGSYYVALGGEVDALVFAGGIGEKGARFREAVVEKASCLGFEIDAERNARKIEQVVQDVGREGARHRTLVVQTDEQFEMARQCAVDPKLFG